MNSIIAVLLMLGATVLWSITGIEQDESSGGAEPGTGVEDVRLDKGTSSVKLSEPGISGL